MTNDAYIFNRLKVVLFQLFQVPGLPTPIENMIHRYVKMNADWWTNTLSSFRSGSWRFGDRNCVKGNYSSRKSFTMNSSCDDILLFTS